MARQSYVYDRRTGELVPKEEYQRPEPIAPMIMPDIQPYQSMLDGSMIKSRSMHREHLRAHNAIEIGNEKQTNGPYKPAPNLKRDIIEAYKKVKYGSR